MNTAWTIAHIDAEMGFSGGENQVLLLMSGLRDRGHRGVLISPPGSQVEIRARALNLETRAAKMRNDVDLAGILSLRRTLAEVAPDVVHLHTGRATWLGGLAARLARVPAITTRRMDRTVGRGLRTKIIYRSLVRSAAAVSMAVARCLEAGGVPQAMIVLVPDAIAPARQFANAERDAIRVAMGASPSAMILLSVASLTQRKGVDVLIEAITELDRRGLQLEVWIAGDGPERDNLLGLIAARNLSSSIRLLGHRSDVPELLAACDLFVLPARREGLGVAVLEAMAAGKPVVASRVGGLAESVVDGQTGLLVPSEDPLALATAIHRVCADATLRARIASAGPPHVAAGFAVDRMVKAYEDLYAAAIAKPVG